jgi:Activator of Hsp90 ATPase homolog 1-like protein
MDNAMAIPPNFVLHIHQEIEIRAPLSVVFDSVLEQVGPGFTNMEGKSMNAKLEAWPGGRWYRDLGNNTGHLWGHVQVIKPPTLLELYGPMMMSYAVISHVQYRLTEKGSATLLALTHRAIGEISTEHREGVNKGWGKILSDIKARATK